MRIWIAESWSYEDIEQEFYETFLLALTAHDIKPDDPDISMKEEDGFGFFMRPRKPGENRQHGFKIYSVEVRTHDAKPIDLGLGFGADDEGPD